MAKDKIDYRTSQDKVGDELLDALLGKDIGRKLSGDLGRKLLDRFKIIGHEEDILWE